MKFPIIFMLPLFIFLQTGSCEDDSSDDGSLNENFVTFLGVTNEANGGCNVESTTGTDSSCVFSGAYQFDGQGYAIAISHTGLCRTGTFQLRDNIDQPSNAFFVIQITENGVAVETYTGFSGTVNLTDTGNTTSMRFEGTVVNNETGEEETIEGFMECPI